MKATAKPKARKAERRIGGLTISPFDRGRVWINLKNGEGGTFPANEVHKALRSKTPAKSLREYFERNLP